MKRFLVLLFAFLVLGFAAAQDDNPVSVRLEIYVVSEINGEEEFKESTTARPGQVVEYRLFAVNNGDTTLPSGAVTVTGPVPNGTSYLTGTATAATETLITQFSLDGNSYNTEETALAAEGPITSIQWIVEEAMEPEQEAEFVYRVTVNKSE